MAKLGRLMYFDVGRVDDDIVLMVVVIPNAEDQAYHNDDNARGVVVIDFTFRFFFEQFHFFLFRSELNNRS